MMQLQWQSDPTPGLISPENRPGILFHGQTICLGRVSPVQVWYALTVQFNPDVTYR